MIPRGYLDESFEVRTYSGIRFKPRGHRPGTRLKMASRGWNTIFGPRHVPKGAMFMIIHGYDGYKQSRTSFSKLMLCVFPSSSRFCHQKCRTVQVNQSVQRWKRLTAVFLAALGFGIITPYASICSMYYTEYLYTYIYSNNDPNVGKYVWNIDIPTKLAHFHDPVL